MKGPQGRAVAHAASGHAGRRSRTATITVTRPSDEDEAQGAARPDAHAHRQHGRGRDEGLSRSSSRSSGVGYKAEVRPYGLQLALGFSHPIEYQAPAGIKLTAPQPTQILIEGADKEMVGQVAAEIRSLRPARAVQGQGHQVRRASRSAGRPVRREASNGKDRQAEDSRRSCARAATSACARTCRNGGASAPRRVPLAQAHLRAARGRRDAAARW